MVFRRLCCADEQLYTYLLKKTLFYGNIICIIYHFLHSTVHLGHMCCLELSLDMSKICTNCVTFWPMSWARRIPLVISSFILSKYRSSLFPFPLTRAFLRSQSPTKKDNTKGFFLILIKDKKNVTGKNIPGLPSLSQPVNSTL